VRARGLFARSSLRSANAARRTPARVARYDYRDQFAGIEDDVVGEIRRSLMDGSYILSEEVEAFEEAFAEYLGLRYAVGVNSGTDALVVALTGVGVGPGDEVVTVANTFHASVLAVTRTGARPVLVDCRPDDWLVDPDLIEGAITPKTRAILVVHLFGKVVGMARIREVADRHGLTIVEDACQAVGARWEGGRAGSLGRVGCFSFHPSKNLAAAGDAGAVVTDDPELAAVVRRLRHFGQVRQNEHQELGWNTKLDAFQAVVLRHKLPRLDEWNARRVQIAAEYRRRLGALPVRFQEGEGDSVFHLFQVQAPRRDELLAYLVGSGIDAVVRYPVPIHLQPPFEPLGHRRGDFPVAESQAAETLCLPIRPNLTLEEIGLVCEAVTEFFERRAGEMDAP
jgi:dTDP-4-amino-4,6-dideoxygalactose transaminase